MSLQKQIKILVIWYYIWDKEYNCTQALATLLIMKKKGKSTNTSMSTPSSFSILEKVTLFI
jgi:hypothetical protein